MGVILAGDTVAGRGRFQDRVAPMLPLETSVALSAVPFEREGGIGSSRSLMRSNFETNFRRVSPPSAFSASAMSIDVFLDPSGSLDAKRRVVCSEVENRTRVCWGCGRVGNGTGPKGCS